MPKVIDLFAGAGGLSLGAVKSGFDLVGAVELDPIAIASHKLNFPISQHLQYDVSNISGKEILNLMKIKKGELSGLIGGPPCQGFSSIGKQAANDPRNRLFIHFFRLVKELDPSFFLAENVPGILSSKFDSVRNEAYKLIPKKFHILPPLTLNAQDFGIPTARQRIFFIGYDPKRVDCLFPEIFDAHGDTKFNYVRDALLGLPTKVLCNEAKNKEYYWCKIDKPKSGSYADNLSKLVPPNIGNEHALRRFFELSETTGMNGTNHSLEVSRRYTELLPGHVDKISRSYRLDMNGFCPTLRAGTDREHGAFQAVRPLHPIEGRVITPREAARLQGFPDWFLFHNTKWHSFRQIGNSVSPLLSHHILDIINKKIK